MITLIDITAEGFGSIINNTTFNLDNEGLNIIRGKVGAGKTSIPSSLYWVCYGKPLKKGSSIDTWPELRTDKYKGTMVKLNLKKGNDNYQVIRCLNYKGVIFGKTKGGSKIVVLKEGKEITAKGKAGIQGIINDILGYSPDLFINSIIYGQRLKRIIEESGPNKKKIFDEAFETLFIDKAKGKAAESEKELTSLLNLNNLKLDNKTNNLKEVEKTYNDLIEYENNFENDIISKLEDITDRKIVISNKINKAKGKLDGLNVSKPKKLGEKILKIKREIIELKYESDRYSDVEKAIKKHENYRNELKSKKERLMSRNCFTCGGKIDIEKQRALSAINNNEIEQETIAIKKCKKMLDNIDIKGILKDIQDKERDLKKNENLITTIESQVELKETLEESIKEYSEEYDKLTNKYKKLEGKELIKKSDSYIDKKAAIEKEIKVLNRDNRKLTDEIDIYKWLIKDPLSNSGIKAYIFNSLLSQVNENLRDYSEILGFRVEFGIDMGTAAKDFYQVIYKDDIIINYPDLSGGQKQLVDTAIALAIHSVIASVRPINVLFLDEPFEGLDNDTIDVISDIISYKAQGRSLFIITHHLSFNPTNSNNIYFSLDKNGATEIN